MQPPVPPSAPPHPSIPTVPVAPPVPPVAPPVPPAAPAPSPGWPPPVAYPPSAPVPVPVWPGAPTPTPPQGASGISIAGMVLGIIAAVLAFIPCLNFIGAIMAVIGLILSLCGMGSPKKGPAIAGLILSLTAILVTVLMYVILGSIDDPADHLFDPDDTSFRTY